jgi:hypothetical protein
MSAPGTIMRRAATLVALALALASCGSAGRKLEADDTARSLLAQCEMLRQSGRLKSRVAVVDCALPRTIDAYTAAGYSYMDLIYVSLQALRNGADRIDRGQASEAEVEREMQALQIRIDAEDQRRRDLMSRGGAVTPVDPETLVAGLDALAPRSRATPLPPPVNCATFGPFGNCN